MAKEKTLLSRMGFKNAIPPERDFANVDYSAMTIGNEYSYIGSIGQMKTQDWLKEYNVNPRLSGLNKIVEDNGVSDYGIFQYDNTKGKLQILDHPLELMIDKHTGPMFFSLWTAYRFMTGVVYIAITNSGGKPTEFKIFTTQHLESKDNTHYVFKEGDKTYKYRHKDVVIDLALELSDPYNKGYGRAGAIMEEIEASTFIWKYIKSFYVNSARPDAFIIPKATQAQPLPQEKDLIAVADALRSMHKGIENAHKMATLSFDANIQTIPTNHHEMQLLETSKSLRDISHQHFGIPPEIVGIVENSNKATVVAAEHIYAKQVRMPILRHMEDVINSEILPRYEASENYIFEFLDILPDDIELSKSIAKEGREAGSITVNEHRELLGFGKLKGDIGNTLLGSTQSQAPAPTTTEIDEDGNEVTVEVEQTPQTVTVEYEATTRRYRGKTVLSETKKYQDDLNQYYKSKIGVGLTEEIVVVQNGELDE